MTGLSMQLRDDEWQITATETGVQINDAAADALDLEAGSVSLEQLSAAGPSLDFGDEGAPCGAWLRDLVADSGPSLQRATTENGSQIEALTGSGGVTARLSPAPSAFRHLRHGLNNYLNNIQINAELAKLLGARLGEEKLQAAVERVLAECRTTGEFLADQFRPDAMDSNNWYATDTALAALAGPPAPSSGLAKIAASTNLPGSLLHHLPFLLQALAQRLGRPASYTLSTLDNATQPQLVIRIDAEPDAGNCEAFLQEQWATRNENPGSLANLCRQVTSFRAAPSGAWLELTALVQRPV